MKSILVKTALAATVAAIGLAGASATSAATKFNVALDGFCNTFALKIDSFAVYGSRSGCGYTVVDGGTVATVGSPYYISNDENDKHSVFTWYFTPPSGGVGNWYLYNETKKGFTEVNSGTYTETAGSNPPKGGRDVTDVASRSAKSLPTH